MRRRLMARLLARLRFSGRRAEKDHKPLTLLVVVVVGAVFIGGAVASIVNLRDDREAYSELLRTNTWIAGQIELETWRFLRVFDRYRLGDASIDPQQVRTRYDILWSRVPIALHGVEARQLRQIDGATASLEALLADLQRFDGVMRDLERAPAEDLAQLSAALSEHAQQAHALWLSIHTGEGRARLRQHLDDNHNKTILSVGFLILVGSLIVVILLLEYSRSRRAARREHALRERAVAANQSKSLFLANMSHELRTPLNAIAGFAQVMRKGMFGELGNEKYREYVQDIDLSAQHLLGIISDLLDISRIEAGALDIEETEFDLCAHARESLNLLQSVAGNKAIRIRFEPEVERLTFLGDPRLCRQIIVNLISNAVKFSPRESSVRVRLHVSGTMIDLTVSDDGKGIPESEIPLLGRPFARASNAADGAEGGSGLGLALVRSFVEAHGGAMAIRSRENHGTTVTVSFPPWRHVAGTRRPTLRQESPAAPAPSPVPDGKVRLAPD